MSGLDYYMNDAGLLLQRNHDRADPLQRRRRSRWPRAFAASCNMPTRSTRPSRSCCRRNNGLYSNEWLLGDIKTNEVAMFELGTHKHKLWRSSKREYPGGTEGFYWGCNNTKDLEVRKETAAQPGRPSRRTWCSIRTIAT